MNLLRLNDFCSSINVKVSLRPMTVLDMQALHVCELALNIVAPPLAAKALHVCELAHAATPAA